MSKVQQKQEQNYINHVVLVLDASSSMQKHAAKLVEVVDAQIAYLAQRSKELDQETRVTVYVFSYRDNIQRLIYDKDVLRMPSIKGLYVPCGMTALVDATLVALGDLGLTPEKYGEHAFLFYAFTDGIENNSRNGPGTLFTELAKLPDHWTVAALVPNRTAVFEAKKFGFPAGNVEVWDATTAQGITEGVDKVRQATDNFMVGRSKGVRGSTNLFSLNVVSERDFAANLVSLTPGSYDFGYVAEDTRIDDYVSRAQKRPYVIGRGYYQLTKTETIQAKKNVVILTSNNEVYGGAEARKMLGLPDDQSVRVKPGDHPYTIFVQSTAPNRKLIRGTRVLMMR